MSETRRGFTVGQPAPTDAGPCPLCGVWRLPGTGHTCEAGITTLSQTVPAQDYDLDSTHRKRCKCHDCTQQRAREMGR